MPSGPDVPAEYGAGGRSPLHGAPLPDRAPPQSGAYRTQEGDVDAYSAQRLDGGNHLLAADESNRHPRPTAPRGEADGRRNDDDDDDDDDMSAASDCGDAVEPRSVMMPPTKRRVHNGLLDEDGLEFMDHDDEVAVPENDKDSLFSVMPRHGDLDDVPDDYELNIEGFRFTPKSPYSISDGDPEPPPSSGVASSLLRPFDKKYIKLEVISAKQIRSLVLFFNLFAILSVAYSLVFIGLNNTVFKVFTVLPIPISMLTKSQTETPNSVCFAIPKNRSVQSFPVDCSSILDEPGSSFAARSFLASVQHIRDCPALDAAGQSSISPGDRLLASKGFYMMADGLAEGPICPLWDISPQVPLTFRQPQPPPMPISPDEPIDFYIKSVGLSTAVLSNEFKIALHSVATILSLFFLVLSFLFANRLWRAKRRNITHEQMWVLVLIIVTAMYFNAFENIIDLVQLVLVKKKQEEAFVPFPSWVRELSDFLSILRDASFMTFTFFYLWASFHSYRILKPSEPLTFTKFYLPKILVLLPLLIFHIVIYFTIRLRFTEVPLLSAPGLAFIFSDFKYWNYLKTEMALCIFKTLYDLFIVALIIVEGTKTMRKLQQVPYMKYRAKRVGFRFFLYINFLFYLLFFVLYLIVLVGKPKGDLIAQITLPADRPRAGHVWLFTSGLWMLITGYVLCTAYVHLPHTSVGWFVGWFCSSTLGAPGSRWSFPTMDDTEKAYGTTKTTDDGGKDISIDTTGNKMDIGYTDASVASGGITPRSGSKWRNGAWSNDDETPHSLVDNDSELQQQIVEPITYRKRESKDSLELKANCFTMQTHVIMFNFAWYVYYYGTPKLNNFRPEDNPLPFQYEVDRHIKSADTDTQALVLDCVDRIIVTFKGTTSMKNLRTSLRLSHVLLRHVIRLNSDGTDESDRLWKLFGLHYTRGKIHKGFATAYMSVMDEVVDRVRLLREKKLRPVFLTGHSLGGALATICSLDLWVKLNISRREIFVSTFGSPRVGNADFAAVYSEVVPLHWRIVVDPDMIAKLPRVGYTHVGKKVVLTPHGDMIIDPNALEQRPWTGDRSGIVYHRKASYLLAMRAWCVRNHGMTYTPVFWPFPLRREDRRRFASALSEEGDGVGSGGGMPVAEKIIILDAMVDALGRVDRDNMDMDVVEKWARLTRRAYLNYTLAVKANAAV